MKKNNSKYFMAVMLAVGYTVGMTSCNSGEPVAISEQAELEVSEESNMMSGMPEEDIEIVYLAILNNANSSTGKVINHLPCASVTNDTDLHVVTIDFGDGCTGPYGRERSGKILVHYSGEFNDQLANRIITFENYVVNNRQITGTIELRNINRNMEGFIEASRELKNYTITFPNGDYTSISGQHTREWIEGEGDENPLTNVYRLTGGVEARSSRGRMYSQTIVQPVISSFACHSQGGFLRISGTIEWKFSGEARTRTRVIDYGSGECDNSYTVTISGKLFTISG